MNIDGLTFLSRAIDAALEALYVPTLLLLGATLVVMTGTEIRARVRRRRQRSDSATATTRETRASRARGAEA
jgi:hypothetical protein